MKKILFDHKAISIDLGILLLRLFFGAAMLTHGYPKFIKMMSGDFSFGDPLGIGHEASLILTVFAEFFCSILLIIGLFTRLTTIPLMITMGTAFFIVHGADPFGTKEKAILFLGAYMVIFFTGPGKYSLDKKIG